MSILITFEGGDGSGKSTQAKALARFLIARGYKVISKQEPGGTALGDEWLRPILLDLPKQDKKYMAGKRAQVLGFCMARAELVEKVIKPALDEENNIVICDRYADSTIAYQVFGERQRKHLKVIQTILDYATFNIRPDLTIYLDVPIEVGLQRARGRIGKLEESQDLAVAKQLTFLEFNHFDERKLLFHKRVREGYEWLMKQEPERWFRVSPDQPIEAVAEIMRRRVLALLTARGIRAMGTTGPVNTRG